LFGIGHAIPVKDHRHMLTGGVAMALLVIQKNIYPECA
jgi:hypothetical protein